MLLLRINRSVAARSQLLFSQKSDKRTYLHRTQRVLFFDVSKDVLIEQHQLNNHREHFFVTGNTKTLFPTETIWPSCGSPLTLRQPIIAQTGEEGHDWEPEGKTETHTEMCDSTYKKTVCLRAVTVTQARNIVCFSHWGENTSVFHHLFIEEQKSSRGHIEATRTKDGFVRLSDERFSSKSSKRERSLSSD